MQTRATAGVALVAVAVAVAAAAAELLVRLASPQAIGLAPAMYVADSLLVHALAPGYAGTLRSGEYATTLSINERGFRGPSWRTDTQRRVLVVGDSFTFGYGVEYDEAYPAVAGRMLARAGCPASVYNAGVPGYGTLQERALIRRLIPVINPHVVVVGFTVGSDVSDNLEQGLRPASGYEVRNGFLVQKGMPAGTPLPLKAWLQERSHLYVLIQRARVRAAVGRARARPDRLPCEHFMAEEPCGDMRKAWDLTRDALRDIGAQCEEAGVRLAVLVIPHPVQVDDGLWERERARAGDAALDRYGVNRIIEGLCETMGAVCVDPIPRFRAHEDRRLFFKLDRHLTAEGHERAADALTPQLYRLLDCGGDTPAIGYGYRLSAVGRPQWASPTACRLAPRFATDVAPTTRTPDAVWRFGFGVQPPHLLTPHSSLLQSSLLTPHSSLLTPDS